MRKELTDGQRQILRLLRTEKNVDTYRLHAPIKGLTNSREIRYSIKGLRDMGYNIIPVSSGYLLSRSAPQIFKKAEAMEHQAKSMLKTASMLRRRARSMTSRTLVKERI